MDPWQTFFVGLAGAMIPVAVFLAREWGKGKKVRDVKKASAEAEVSVIEATADAKVTTIAAEAAAAAAKLEAESKKEITGVHQLQAQAELQRAVTDEKRSAAELERAAAEKHRAEEDAITKKQLKSWIDELRGDLEKCEANHVDLKAANEECEKRSMALAEELLEIRDHIGMPG